MSKCKNLQRHSPVAVMVSRIFKLYLLHCNNPRLYLEMNWEILGTQNSLYPTFPSNGVRVLFINQTTALPAVFLQPLPNVGGGEARFVFIVFQRFVYTMTPVENLKYF